ncbi:MAG TPA: CDP-alcohol phosphatidyltransferase family protein [Candidatus Nitrosotalea sp.]|jgi:phosphatidylglycerophosphate synthase|nr:CDP-alcohol phosphatidyltransferase family protein [Candidatus Nitrosotalea sp.]
MTSSIGAPLNRRPVGLRELSPVRHLAAQLARAGFRPNQISLLGVGVSTLGAACLLITTAVEPGWRSLLFLGAAAVIPLRGLCNLCDGLMAIEGRLRTRSGEIFNDLPDRFSDALMLVAAGYAIPAPGWGPGLGWLAALLAALTAHVRVLGVAAGAAPQFGGPMAKTHRMVVLGAASVGAGAESLCGLPPRALGLGLFLVTLGCAITIVRRTGRIVRDLESP